MEGGNFNCGWKKSGKLYRVWVKGRPKLTARGKTFAQADRRLWTAIIDATGDGESIRSYDPPEPESTPVRSRAADLSAWIARLKKRPRRRPDREPLAGDARIGRRFAERVEEHFAFLREAGFRGPKFSREFSSHTGVSFLARFASRRRVLLIDLGKAYREYSNEATFTIRPVPAGDRAEWFLSGPWLAQKRKALLDAIAEFDLTHTLDEIMQVEFPLYADLFRSELRPLLTGEQWHHDYDFYKE
jgi:hypothetical protein